MREEEQAACLQPSLPKMNSGTGHSADTFLRLPRGFVTVPSPLQSAVLGMPPLEDGKWPVQDHMGAGRQAGVGFALLGKRGTAFHGLDELVQSRDSHVSLPSPRIGLS